MAVFTPVSAEQMAGFLERYDQGTLVSAKGIAEGVQNSNFLVETSTNRFILTLYEQERVDAADLPFFLALTDHLADAGLPVPRAIPDRSGRQIGTVADRPACLIQFLPGVSLTHPTVPQARIVGEALGRMHAALQGFTPVRTNALGLAGWQALAARCGDRLDPFIPGFSARIATELDWLAAHWPADLPLSAIHADLFPDNVLMLDDRLTGIIDFYFACTDIRAWDVAVTHAAWCFEADGTGFSTDRATALMTGYAATFGLSADERAHFRTLLRGAAMRFTMTRAWDWISTPADALVVRKDPLAFLRRLDFYATASDETLGL